MQRTIPEDGSSFGLASCQQIPPAAWRRRHPKLPGLEGTKEGPKLVLIKMYFQDLGIIVSVYLMLSRNILI